MTHRKQARTLLAITAIAMLMLACQSSGGGERSEPPAVPDIEGARTVTAASPAVTVSPSPTTLPVIPSLATHVVQSGDTPTLIAEQAGVPPEQRDAWIEEMLALNGVDATALQVGQKLVLPPAGFTGSTARSQGSPSSPSTAGGAGTGSAPSAGTSAGAGTGTSPVSGVPSGNGQVVVTGPDGNPIVIQVAQPIGSTPTPQTAVTQSGGAPPFVPTPPFVAFVTTPTPVATPTPEVSPTPTPQPTYAAGARAWLTSSDENALYYYCDLDTDWKSIPPDKLLAFDSEQQLLAIWGRFRTKAPDSAC